MTKPILRISDDEVSEVASSFLQLFQPTALIRPIRTDIVKLLDALKTKYQYRFVIEELGKRQGTIVLGQTNLRNKTIAISESFYGRDENKTIRVPFVLAHEMGHVVLHEAHYPRLKMAGVFEEIITETQKDRKSVV